MKMLQETSRLNPILLLDPTSFSMLSPREPGLTERRWELWIIFLNELCTAPLLFLLLLWNHLFNNHFRLRERESLRFNLILHQKILHLPLFLVWTLIPRQEPSTWRSCDLSQSSRSGRRMLFLRRWRMRSTGRRGWRTRRRPAGHERRGDWRRTRLCWEQLISRRKTRFWSRWKLVETC